MKKILIAILFVASLFVIFGCTQLPVCGNGLCEIGEDVTCVSDCGGSQIDQTQARAAWKSAEPWAIMDWSMDGDEDITITLQNNSGDTLELNTVKAGLNTSGESVNESVSAGATKTITVNGVIAAGGTAGDKYVITKDTIVIDFNSATIDNKTQYGVEDIVGNQS